MIYIFYITGDTHGEFDKIEEFYEHNFTTVEDVIIILGDAGINYYLSHEERPSNISTYEEKEWYGGAVYYEENYPNFLFAIDGEIYDFDGKKAIAIGGAYSLDKYDRMHNGTWFEYEQPDEAIKMQVEQALERHNWRVDFVFSHAAPLKFEPTDMFLTGIDQSNIDKETEIWLDTIEGKLEYEHWFFGHYHGEQEMEKFSILFYNIEDLEDYF